MAQSNNTSKILNWNAFWWLVGSICIPISIPYIVCRIMNQLLLRKNKNLIKDKVVVITGASSGIGEALAHTFYMAGCKIVLAARRKEELERVRTDLLECHSNDITHPPVIIQMDVAELETIPGKVEQIEQIFGHIDILINNAGVSVRADVASMDMEVDQMVMNVNYFGAVALTKAVLPKMMERKEGRIICVSSLQGKFALPYRSAYSASKHALQAFSDSLRAEMSEYGISVLCVSLGYVNTALSLNALTAKGRPHGKIDATQKGGASPEKVAEDIYKAVLQGQKDIVLAPIHHIAIQWLRLICPPIYYFAMEKQARRTKPSLQ